jgi:hypothetical protein
MDGLAELDGLRDAEGETLAEGDTPDPLAAFISMAITANSPATLEVKSTVVSLSERNSVVPWIPLTADSSSAVFVKPLPAVTVTPKLPTAMAP